MKPLFLPQKPSSPPASEPLAVSASEAARLLGVSEKTLRTWTKKRIIPVCRIEGRVLYSLDHLRRLINGGDKGTDEIVQKEI